MELKRNKDNGILESWENGKKIGEIVAFPGTFASKADADEYFRRNKNMSIDDIRAFIERQSWIFAKTYANKAPHEYVVRDRINGTDEEFLAVVNFIQEKGITMYFWNHPNKYIFVDGYQYWVMRDSDDDPTTILNRCNVDEYKYSIAWKGKNNVV